MKHVVAIILFFLIISCENHSVNFTKLHFEFQLSWEPYTSYNFDLNKNELEVFRLDEWSRDTVFKKNFDLSELDTEHFYEGINSIHYDSSSVVGNMWLDGKSFKMSKISENDTIRIGCLNPHRNLKYNVNGYFDKEYKILGLLFDFIAKNVDDSTVLNFSKQVYTRFDGKLEFRKVSENPLEYSVWGSRNFNAPENDSLNLVEFMKELPDNRPVIIELNSLRVSDFWVLDNDKFKNLYFYGQSYLEWIHEGFTRYEKEIIIDTTPDPLLRVVIPDTICFEPQNCIYHDSSTMKHEFYHDWINHTSELNKMTNNYYLTRNEALSKVQEWK